MRVSKNIPVLRFKEFNGEWINRKLGELILKLDSGISVNSIDEPVDRIDQSGILKTSCISSGKFYPEQNKKIISEDIVRAKLNPVKGSILISRMNTPQLVGHSGLIEKDYPNLFVPDRLWMIIIDEKNVNSKLLSIILSSEKTMGMISNIATGTSGSMKNISKPNFLNLEIHFPSLPEQQKIASFLSAVDEKIQQLTRKKELLEQYKKGVMQQLFSSSELGFVGLEDDRISEEGLGDDRIDADDKNNPTILKSKKSKFRQLRFKDENGKAYPKWEEKRLGEVCESIKSGRDKASEEGSFPLYGSTGKIGNSNEYSHDGNYILIARVGANAGTINLIDGKFAVSDNTLVVSCYDKKSIKYVFYYLNFFNLNKLIFGSGQPLITGGQLKDLQLPFPSKEEQQKISNFLSAIDAKIETVATQIEKTQTFKKGLLQQMFV